MIFVQFIPLVLSTLLVGAHFLHVGQHGMAAATLCFLLVLFGSRRGWVALVSQMLLVISALMWVKISIDLVFIRQMIGESWLRLAIILGAVCVFTAASSMVFTSTKMKQRYSQNIATTAPSATAFLITAALLSIIQIQVDPPMLLLERFAPGWGWLEILILSTYAAWVTEKMMNEKNSGKWRRRIWLGFSIFFFAQLIIGMAGIEEFLMSGNLHLPVPAVIAAGPVYRGEGFFMPILLGITLILVGPAWCSHLCYLGAWDNFFSSKTKRPKKLPGWTRLARIGSLLTVIGVAYLLRILGASVAVASAAGLIFGAVGIISMVTWSRKTGVMSHCTVFCPIAAIATFVGKLSPFRIRIGEGCDDCAACRPSCRFDALNTENILSRRPGITCTLCGDCVGKCPKQQIEYSFAGISSQLVRTYFVVLITALHTVFLAVARI